MENVPPLLQEKNISDFGAWCEYLESIGYKNYYRVLNAKDFGIPQNRERVFMVSIFGDYDFEFPLPIKLKYTTKDIQEPESTVDEKYYLTVKQLNYILDMDRVCDDTKRGDIGDRTVNPKIAKTISVRGAKDQRADITNFVVGNNDKSYTIDDLRNVLSETGLKKAVCDLAIDMLSEGDVVDVSYATSRLTEIMGGGASCKTLTKEM